jgi:uncharacterized membrane protein
VIGEQALSFRRIYLGQRLLDYLLVAIVILCVFGLFRISRIFMRSVLAKLKKRYGVLDADRILLTGFFFLLSGLMFLPAFTSLLAVINNRIFTGGMVLHLVLVAISVILFSIAEDLFRDFSNCPLRENWSVNRHFKYISIPLISFWAIGCILLSPVFYSGLTLIVAIFYLFALSCRSSKKTGNTDSFS